MAQTGPDTNASVHAVLGLVDALVKETTIAFLDNLPNGEGKALLCRGILQMLAKSGLSYNSLLLYTPYGRGKPILNSTERCAEIIAKVHPGAPAIYRTWKNTSLSNIKPEHEISKELTWSHSTSKAITSGERTLTIPATILLPDHQKTTICNFDFP
ncbi:hypothetical protein N7474_005390 [Penicillium riverlandense]|uniref:uncharacterized protein n=1 Tax=Penicillium riverlandense TaxID=1903569 RepID=UPI002548F422|nr:uncharacterized protein N7474_005390 [Penicillium riverlandense]KAJ5819799.1 hypothetical protein N7474_005390 [Penicillium riverlandense]